eukprot:5190611-Alexandrium_andersonii.AAC.1
MQARAQGLEQERMHPDVSESQVECAGGLREVGAGPAAPRGHRCAVISGGHGACNAGIGPRRALPAGSDPHGSPLGTRLCWHVVLPASWRSEEGWWH